MRAGISSASSSSRNSAMALAHLRRRAVARQPACAATLGQGTYAGDVGLAFGRGDHATRIQQVEQMACLHALIVSRQRQWLWPVEQHAAFPFRVLEMAQENVGVG